MQYRVKKVVYPQDFDGDDVIYKVQYRPWVFWWTIKKYGEHRLPSALEMLARLKGPVTVPEPEEWY